MNSRERMLAVFDKKPVDCFPVTVPYLMLSQADHWTKITQQPSWTYYAWVLMDPQHHIQEYQRFDKLLPFDIAQPNDTSHSGADRQYLNVVEELAGHFELDSRTGSRKKLIENLHEKDDQAEWPRIVFTEKDADERIQIRPATEIIERGGLDYTIAYKAAYGMQRFITGTVINSFYMSSHYVGLTNRFLLVHDEASLMHYIIDRITRANIELIRAMAQAGCDAVFIDDATATLDMISPKMYNEFSLPYLKRQIDEVHAQGMKAIVIYFGGIADRVENIIQTGADALLMETSMKGFTNDLETISAQVNNRMLLFGNLDPIGDIELKSDSELESKMTEQIAIGKKYGRFVISTGSPLTPHTSLARIQKYIKMGHRLSQF